MQNRFIVSAFNMAAVKNTLYEKFWNFFVDHNPWEGQLESSTLDICVRRISLTWKRFLSFSAKSFPADLAILPGAGDHGDFWELQVQQHVFLIIHHIHSGPVHRNDNVILGQTWPGELVRFVETREEQRPFEPGVVYNVLLDFLRMHILYCVVALWEAISSDA